jgi:hypothetical protein
VSVKVRIPSQLRQLTGGEGLMEMDAGTVGGIIMELEPNGYWKTVSCGGS